jgi:hypothetical protein
LLSFKSDLANVKPLEGFYVAAEFQPLQLRDPELAPQLLIGRHRCEAVQVCRAWLRSDFHLLTADDGDWQPWVEKGAGHATKNYVFNIHIPQFDGIAARTICLSLSAVHAQRMSYCHV